MNRVGDSTHGIEASQDHDDKEKREERRAKSEERRERREERREKKEERRDPKRGRQRSPNEAARGGPTLFLAMPPPGGTSGGLSWGPFGDLATAQKHAVDVSDVFFCFSWGAGGVFPKDSMTLGPSRWLAVAA